MNVKTSEITYPCVCIVVVIFLLIWPLGKIILFVEHCYK